MEWPSQRKRVERFVDRGRQELTAPLEPSREEVAIEPRIVSPDAGYPVGFSALRNLLDVGVSTE